MLSILLTSQYSTSPDEKLRNIKVNMIGMIIMIFCCFGSAADGVIFCCMNEVAPITSGSGPSAKPPKNGMPSGIWPKSVSGAARLVIQSMNGACLSSIAVESIDYKAKKTGICRSIGRHPPIGLTLFVL